MKFLNHPWRWILWRWLVALPLRLRALFRRDELAAELNEELVYHLDRETEAGMARGLSKEEARRAARRALGNTTSHKERARDEWSWARLEVLARDLRFAARALAKSPGFAATAILTLALGIGASTAIFSVVDAALLKPLTFSQSERLVALWEVIPAFIKEPSGANERHIDLLMKSARSFEGFSFVSHGSAGVTTNDSHPQSVGVVFGSTNLFDILAVRPAMGSAFTPRHGIDGNTQVAVVTNAFWRGFLQADPQAIGKTIRLGDQIHTVIGVLPENFHFPNHNELRAYQRSQVQTGVLAPSIFLPSLATLDRISWTGNFGNRVTVARLRPGVSVAQAQAELDTLTATVLQPRIAQESGANGPRSRPGALSFVVEPLRNVVVGQSRSALWFLLAAVLGLMLIACVNLANTQLARSLSRTRESAIRGALGAPRWRIVWIALAENLLLCLAGGVSGILLAAAGLRVLRQQTLVHVPRLAEVRIETGVLLFALVLIIGSALLFSMLPLLRGLRLDPQVALHQGGNRVFGSQAGRRTQAWLVGAQVFGCTVLLLLSGIFAKNLMQILTRDRGFTESRLVMAQANPSGKDFASDGVRLAFIDGVLRKLREIPGVENAAYVNAMPLEGESWIEPMERVDRKDRDGQVINLRFVSPGYFETMRHRLEGGRFFEEADRGRKSIVLTANLAKALWPEGNAIGGQVRVSGETFDVVGIAGDSNVTSLKNAPVRTAFVMHTFRNARMIFVARGAQGGDELTKLVREAIWSFAPQVAIPRVKTIEAQVRESLGAEHVQTYLLAAFALAALLLSAIGIYGVLSYTVASRRQEIGVRLALGASRRQIFGLTLGGVSLPVIAGLALGFGASLAASSAIQRVQFGTAGLDAGLGVGVAIVFLAVAGLSGWLPARRAAQTDPLASLRAD